MRPDSTIGSTELRDPEMIFSNFKNVEHDVFISLLHWTTARECKKLTWSLLNRNVFHNIFLTYDIADLITMGNGYFGVGKELWLNFDGG